MDFAENVIVMDADYIDKVAFDLIVNFERMLERRIPPADLPRLVECIALDGGLRPGEGQQTQVLLLHNAKRATLDNINPSTLSQLNQQAFNGPLGEFVFSCITSEGLATKESLMKDTVDVVAQSPAVRRLMIVPNEEDVQAMGANASTAMRANASERLSATIFTMQQRVPMGALRFEILGYSMLRALGISSGELSGKFHN